MNCGNIGMSDLKLLGRYKIEPLMTLCYTPLSYGLCVNHCSLIYPLSAVNWQLSRLTRAHFERNEVVMPRCFWLAVPAQVVHD